MKADLPLREPERLRQWEARGLYQAIRRARVGAPRFVLHDGPPYTNSPIHIGTVLNKCLKDFVVKYKTLRGFDCPYVPGYDNHGLPIELAVQEKLGRSLSGGEMRAACRAHASEYIAIQTEQFKRMGVLGDWEHRYATMDFGFEATVVRVFARLVEKGFVYRDLRPTHWSFYSKTALADTELVYEPHTSRAIYVRFPLKGGETVLGVRHRPLYALIWTTTPWTIPANLALAFHPELRYAVVGYGGGFYLIYEGLVERVCGDLGWSDYAVVSTIPGSALEGVLFVHPLFGRDSLGVLADYVTTSDGTGIVHTAPGHGADDFATGRRYGLAILCPVDEGGVFTAEAGEFAGQTILEADSSIPKALSDAGHLLKVYDYAHSYPYSERDKHPVIFRTTEQWFLNVSHAGLRERALAAIEGVRWYPKSGASRLGSMVSERPDWCLSRQRIWGVGLPILYGVPSGVPLLDAAVMSRVADLVEARGSGAWFEASLDEILPAGYRHPTTGETDFRKETDVLDVWFDSGVTHVAVLSEPYSAAWGVMGCPADLYLEGSDQHRGWFNSSLMTSIALNGTAPYRTVVTHGFVVDEKGEKMSKSKGNVVDPIASAEKYGADVLRLWVGSVDYSRDIPCGPNLLSQVGEMYRRIRNTLRFLLANLYDFDPTAGHGVTEAIDAWALAETQLMEWRVCREYDAYDFSAATSVLHHFCVRELSGFYLDVIKDRMYCDPKDSSTRRSGQAACHEILMRLTRLIAPILPFTSEEVYERIPLANRLVTVFLEHLNPVRDEEASELLESDLLQRFRSFLRFKDELYVSLEEWKSVSGVKDSQDILAKVSVDATTCDLLRGFGEDLPTFLRLSWVEVEESSAKAFHFEESPYLKCERSRLRRPDVELVDGVALSRRDRLAIGL